MKFKIYDYENNISMVAKPTYSKVDSEEDMIETGKFYIMDPDGSGSYIIYVVTEEGETLSISSTNIDMSDYQTKSAPDLETDNKFVLEAINEVNDKFVKQRNTIGANSLIEGLDGSDSSIFQYISDVYNKFIKFVGSVGNLTTNNKDTIVNSINEIISKLGNLEDLNDLIQKSSFVNSINNLYDMSQVRVGTVIPYAGSTAPSGFVLCDGSALNPNDYPNLYDVIGTKYGVTSDGKFKVPNLKEKVVASTNQASLLGISFGTNKTYLSNDEMPSHTHTINSETHTHSSTTSDSASKSFGKRGSKNGDDGSDGDSSTDTVEMTMQHEHPRGGSCSASHTHTCPFYPNYDDFEAHENMMPYIILNYIIKY